MTDSSFSKEQFSAIYPLGIERHYWNNSRNMIIADILARINPRAIIDIGAGRGLVTAYLAGKGFTIVGVEPAILSAADVALAESKEKIFFGKRIIEVPADIRENIDTALMLDVIEHIISPQDIFSEVAMALPNVRTMVITVPGRMELWSNYDEFNGHKRRYDRQMLERDLEASGWSQQSSKYFFHGLYIPARLIALVHGRRNTTIKAPCGWRVPLHALLAWYFYLEYKLLTGSIPGSSIVAVFTK